jgi:uncharacterized phosphatase
MEFYFLRHGLVDYGPEFATDATPDVPLNEEGKRQAAAVRHIIEQLPIRTICVSPLMRAQETMNIVAENVRCPVVVVEELRECSGVIWDGMNALDDPIPPQQVEEAVFAFMNRAVAGIHKALENEGPVLVVAHGGIHWAFCHQLEVEHPSKKISHCVPVHFLRHNERWKAKVIA